MMRDKIYKLITSNSLEDIKIGLNIAYNQDEWEWFDSLLMQKHLVSIFLELETEYIGEACLFSWNNIDYVVDIGIIWRHIRRDRLPEHTNLPRIILNYERENS